MSDKERLGEIKEKYSEVTVLEYINDVEIVGVDIKDLVWLIKQAEKAEKYHEALEFYAGGNHYSDKLYDDKIILLDDGKIARKVLEGDDD